MPATDKILWVVDYPSLDWFLERAPEFMRIYTMRDAGGHEKATRDLLAKIFAGKPGALPDWDELGHSGRRLRWIAEYFSWAEGKDFTELGTFGPAS